MLNVVLRVPVKTGPTIPWWLIWLVAALNALTKNK